MSEAFFGSAFQTAALLEVQQKRELAELFGFETRNKYVIRADGTDVGFAAEQQKGFLGFIFRQWLGHWRTFEVHFFSSARELVMVAKHPFRFFFQRLEVSDSQGKSLGVIQQRWAILSKRFDIYSELGEVLLTVSSPLWSPWTFKFERQGQVRAYVRKKWGGLLREVFTDGDRFLIELSAPDLTSEERQLLLAAGLFIDLQYFERKAR